MSFENALRGGNGIGHKVEEVAPGVHDGGIEGFVRRLMPSDVPGRHMKEGERLANAMGLEEPGALPIEVINNNPLEVLEGLGLQHLRLAQDPH
jgi:hypothetical protein